MAWGSGGDTGCSVVVQRQSVQSRGSEHRAARGKALHPPHPSSGPGCFLGMEVKWPHVFSSFALLLEQKTMATFSRGPGRPRPNAGAGRAGSCSPQQHLLEQSQRVAGTQPRQPRTSGTPAASFPLSQHNEPEQRHPPLPGTTGPGHGPYPANSDTYRPLVSSRRCVCRRKRHLRTSMPATEITPVLVLQQQIHLLPKWGFMGCPSNTPPSSAPSCRSFLAATTTWPAAAPGTRGRGTLWLSAVPATAPRTSSLVPAPQAAAWTDPHSLPPRQPLAAEHPSHAAPQCHQCH